MRNRGPLVLWHWSKNLSNLEFAFSFIARIYIKISTSKILRIERIGEKRHKDYYGWKDKSAHPLNASTQGRR
jgi:hypothetical protein